MKEKWNAGHSGWLAVMGRFGAILVVVFTLAGCAGASAPKPTPTLMFDAPAATAMAFVPPTATILPAPTHTATLAPTATPEPSATPTQPPTATPLPALAVQENGFDAWCAPLEYAGTAPTSPDAPDYARKMDAKDTQIQVQIPATYCVLAYRFNQAVPDGTVLTFYDGTNPFLKLPLKAAEGHPDEAWTPVTHSYVINPPFWYVDYRLTVTGSDGKEFWSHSVRFSKSLPGMCPAGGYPDPVTLYCNPFDPREIEPHPEDPDYPYNGLFP